MINRKEKVFLLFIMTLLLPLSSIAQDTQKEWPCGGHPKLLYNKKGNPIWFKSSDLKKRAIHRVIPRYPEGCRCEGTILIDVLVNTEGKVECIRARKGHPLLTSPAIGAVKEWVFKPVVVKGKPVAVFGILAFHFSSDGKVTY